jgi:hypothetical protein
MYQSSSCSVHAVYQPVNNNFLRINCILFTDYVMVMVRVVQKVTLMFLACIVHAGGSWYLPRLLFVGEK